MSITRKTIITVICIFITLFAMVYIISNLIYLRGFENLERKSMLENLDRVNDALAVKLASLDVFCTDWSAWDDTYYFAKFHNQEYIDRNLADETFINGGFNIFLITDPQGDLVYGRAFDIEKERETEFPAGWQADFLTCGIIKPGQEQPYITGITELSGQPILLAANPLLTSLNEGPSTGSLILGRYIDDALIRELSDTTNLPIELLPIQINPQQPELKSIIDSLYNTDPFYVQIQSGDVMNGYTFANDISGNPVFLFKVSMTRDIHAQGIKTVAYFHSSLVFIGIAFGVILMLGFRYLVLNRLTSLSKAVGAIGAKGDMSSRVQVKGKDELSQLSQNINSMLDSLEKSETRRQSQQEIIWHIMASTPNGIIAVSDAGDITMVNEAFRRLFNLQGSVLLDKNIADLPELADIALEIKKFKESRQESQRKELQYTIGDINRMFITNFTRLKEEDIYILYLTDISDERAKQESLYLTSRLASIGEMASGIAHELNNPLTSIIGLSDIIAHEDIPESIREDMNLIKSESHRAAGIVRNLLSFARKNTALKQPTFINKILLDVLKLRSYEHEVNNIKVVQELDPNLPEIAVDYSQIQQVFINIILNAEHAMTTARGKGLLKVKSEVIGNIIRISFTDDGPGITPENMRHIFDPFFTTKEVGKGTGLGLSISYGIITAHNGRIYAISEPGKGATFIIEFPRRSIEASEGYDAA